MAFDNTNFRQCSYNYNNTVGNSGATTDDSKYFNGGGSQVSVSKDIGNTAGAEACIQIELTPVQTVFKENVSITQQVEVFFQARKNFAGVDILSIYPVEQRQGLFRLPQTDTNGDIVYIAEQSGNNDKYYVYLSVATVTQLTKTTKPDGSALLNYSATPEALVFPAPEKTNEYTIKRLTHSITDFVTYQPGGQLTSNLLNFQKGQEMFLIQELLWTIEMDMITFSDLSGNGKIVTTGADGYIPVEDINLSVFDLNDVDDDTNASRAVLYRVGKNFKTQEVFNLINISDIINVSNNTPASNNVLAYNDSSGVWEPKSVSEAAGNCSGILASTLNFCSGSHTDINLTDIFISTSTPVFDITSNTRVMTESGLTKVPLNTLSNVNDSGITDGFLLKYQSSTQTYIPINPASLGTAGDAGGNTFEYAFTATTPDEGQILLSGSLEATTQIFVNNTNADGADVKNWFTSFSVGSNDFVKVFKKGAPENFAIYKLTGVVNNGTIATLAVDNVAFAGTISATNAVYLTHIPSGAAGAAGAPGAQGDAGSQGDTGPAGAAITSGTVAVDGANLVFNFEDNQSGSFPVTLLNWLSIVDATWYYVVDSTVNSSVYGQYTYALNTIANGTGTALTGAVNLAEKGNSGLDASSNRTFQNITYGPPTSISSNQEVHGVNLVNGDVIKLVPIANGTGVMVKNTNEFSTQNVIQLIQCASA
tara:strand:- start:22763 stop:24880 length:2118 start_codon:yes stop_codon:yes gene_type:complete